MNPRRTRRWTGAAALCISLALFAAACASDKNKTSSTDTSASLQGKTVTIFGPEVEQEAQGLQDSFKPFETRTGIKVRVSGDRSFEEQIGVRVDGGNPPDIAMFPQPGKVTDFQEDVVDLPDDVADDAKNNFDEGLTDLVTFDGKLKAIPAKADLKSLVWYSPKAFTDAGYEVPTTQEEFTALVDKMISDKKTAFCVGLGSDAATGWPMTDWIEDYMLRLKGPDVYDKWYKHEIPFDDPDVVEVGQYVDNLWAKSGAVFGGVSKVASTPFADAGLPLLKGDCMLHRQGNFYSANWPDGTTQGPNGDVNAFYLPGSDDNPHITLTGGIYATAFGNRPEVLATMKYLAGTEYSNTRAKIAKGFLSPNKNTDTASYPDEISQNFAKILKDASPIRFDASDLMPGAVGAGTFWSACVDITTGTDVKAAFTAVEKSWPSAS